jgi:hypothetical protein
MGGGRNILSRKKMNRMLPHMKPKFSASELADIIGEETRRVSGLLRQRDDLIVTKKRSGTERVLYTYVPEVEAY